MLAQSHSLLNARPEHFVDDSRGGNWVIFEVRVAGVGMTVTSRPLLCQDSHGCLASYGGVVPESAFVYTRHG